MFTKTELPGMQTASVPTPLSMRELATVLVKHYGIKQGAYDLFVEYQIGVGAVGPDKDNLLPGAMIAVARVGLIAAQQLGPTTVDAALVNKAKKITKKSKET